MIFGYKIWARYTGHTLQSRGVKPIEADLHSGKAAIDAEEAEFLAQEAAKGKNKKAGKFYKRYIGWLL
jgi:amino acid transporter